MQENWFKSGYSLANGNCAEARWRKATASTGNGQCVEVGNAGYVQVRDSKDPGGPVLSFRPLEWEKFVRAQGR
jgi:Domain of unknown function (DUF397)